MLRLFKVVLLLGVLGALAAGGWMLWFSSTPLQLAQERVPFTIEPGSGLRAAVRQIRASGVPISEWGFIALAQIHGHAAQVKAGSYELEQGATPIALLDKITEGDFALTGLTFVEGWTFKQLRQTLDAHPDLRHDTRALPDAEVLQKAAIPQAHPEGWFFPDTYRFAKGTSDLDVLRAAYKAMERRLNEAWAQRTPDLPLASPYEALILASIVEKETGRGDDRAMVAGVFVNRLQRGMLLQTDPTVIYGMGERFNGNIRKQDLTTDTPYNTYTRPGLPPTPIAMPGSAALEATLKPAKTDALYFVARGDGSSHFSSTLHEHNSAVNRYQRR